MLFVVDGVDLQWLMLMEMEDDGMRTVTMKIDDDEKDTDNTGGIVHGVQRRAKCNVTRTCPYFRKRVCETMDLKCMDTCYTSSTEIFTVQYKDIGTVWKYTCCP